MATKHDLLNRSIQSGNVLAVLNLCLENEKFTEICEKDEKIQKKILKFFSNITKDNEQLKTVAMDLIFKHKITDESKIKNILSFLYNLLDERNLDTPILLNLVKLIRRVETRPQGGWIRVAYKPEQEKLYTISGPDTFLKIITNDEDLLKRLFSNYFKINTDFESQIYMM